MIKSVLKLTAASLAVIATGAASGGCLRRDVSPNEPTTKVNVNTRLKQQAVDKIDLLLAIDNSSSMGDKQTFLAQAVPILVSRLVTPNCVEADGTVTGQSTLNEAGEGECASGGTPEFKPITDIHIGIVSSSLGNFGNDSDSDAVCTPGTADAPKIVSDFAKLVNRKPVPSENGNFLAWFPDVQKNQGKPAPGDNGYKDAGALASAFSELVSGVGENGCGLEAQLESMYQFLIAPQPWKEIVLNDNRAEYSGINVDVLQQRHDFLRPDSLVAVIMLTDEDDSSVDPLSVSGTGHYFMARNFPQQSGDKGVTRVDNTTTAARGTAACATDPASPDCQSCAFTNLPVVQNDPGCQEQPYYAADEDDLNVRFFHMKQRFGVDPQYSVQRYVRGLSAAAIADRRRENHDGQPDADSSCVNPLFFGDELPAGGTDDEAGLDALCKLQGSGDPRDPNLVFFALVGGIPNELIDKESGTRDEDGNITADAWKSIVGEDPLNYNYNGQDPRMVQSIEPREGRPGPGSPDDVDPDPLNKSHRDWNTKKIDLQYACTFPIPADLQRPAGQNIDCAPSQVDNSASDAPLCTPVNGTNPRTQIRAKAYPTLREALVVRLLGSQGILGSLCPKVTQGDTNSAEYGYNPAVNEIVDRLKNALTQTCLPQPLTKADDGSVPCLMLELMPADITDCSKEGRTDPDPDVLAKFKETLDPDQQGRTVCALRQNTGADSVDSCQSAGSDVSGWCYLDGDAAGRCSQQIVFNDRILALAKGSTVYLQCINQLGGGSPTPAGDDDDQASSSGGQQ